MNLVVDANVLFSSLIKDSITAELMFEDELTLYTPEFVFEEFLKYEDLILKKTKRTKNDLVKFMHTLNDIIRIIPVREYSAFLKEAEKISPDKKDQLFCIGFETWMLYMVQ